MATCVAQQARAVGGGGGCVCQASSLAAPRLAVPTLHVPRIAKLQQLPLDRSMSTPSPSVQEVRYAPKKTRKRWDGFGGRTFSRQESPRVGG